MYEGGGSVIHIDAPAGPARRGLHIGQQGGRELLIHRSGWKAHSANLALRGFSESPHRFAVGRSSLGTFGGRFSELGGARD